jgi:hypothetical protein
MGPREISVASPTAPAGHASAAAAQCRRSRLWRRIGGRETTGCSSLDQTSRLRMNERTPSSPAHRFRRDAGCDLSHCRSANRWPRSTCRSPSRCAPDVRGVWVSVVPSSAKVSVELPSPLKSTSAILLQVSHSRVVRESTYVPQIHSVLIVPAMCSTTGTGVFAGRQWHSVASPTGLPGQRA